METSESARAADSALYSLGWSEKLSTRNYPAILRFRINFNGKGCETVKHKLWQPPVLRQACGPNARRVGAHPQAVPANAALAQLVEHIIRNDGVVGSSPPSGTTTPSGASEKHSKNPLISAIYWA